MIFEVFVNGVMASDDTFKVFCRLFKWVTGSAVLPKVLGIMDLGPKKAFSTALPLLISIGYRTDCP